MLQQVAGINTVMYFTPVILELAGVHNKRTALLVRTLLVCNMVRRSVWQACLDVAGGTHTRRHEPPEALCVRRISVQ